MKSNKYIRIIIAMLFGFLAQVTLAQEGYPNNTSGTNKEIRVTLPFTSGETTIKVTEINNEYLFEGDIVFPKSGGRGGAALASSSTRWSGSKMPYVIASGHPKRADILWAINHINTNTNVCVVPRTTESDYVEFVYQAGICGSSRLGKVGGKQTIRIGDSCGNTRGSAVHEMMHALGFYHEQSRDDRDRYVTINGSNIISGKSHNFRKYNQSWYHRFWPEGRNMGNYDYGSIMHYGSTAFGKPKSGGGRMTTIVPKRSGVTIGQRNRMSATDIASINGIYPTACSSSSSTSTASSDDPGTSDTSTSSSSSNSSFDISYPIKLIPQTSRVSCWATAAAMIVAWRDNVRSISPEDIARGINGWRTYFYNNGLPPDNTEMFSVWGFNYDHPQSYTVEGFASLLQGGPLWVATDLQDGAHVVVVAGIRGDGTPNGTILKIYDPWEQGMTSFRSSNRGSVYELTYQEFVNRQETLAFRELSEPSAFYVAY